MPSIADLFISVSSDVSGAINGLTEVDQRVNGVSQTMQAAAPAALALAGASAAVGGAFVASISQAADFEHQMSAVNSVLAPDQVNTYGSSLRDLALTLGRDTVFSSNEAAHAIEELVKAGVPVQTVMEGGAASALALAAATGINVSDAANFAGTALNTFHLSAEQLAHTVDTLAGTANASAADIHDLQFAFASAGPVAASLGLSFDDTATALGVFANNGLRGSDAGTSLRTMLLNLEPSSRAQTAAMRELGIITDDGVNHFFDAAGAARPMNEIFQVLRDSTANLTAEQRTNLLQTAFGTDAVRAATIAAAAGAAGFNDLAQNIGQVTAATAAATRLDNLNGSLTALGGSFETLQINIGSLFLPVLRQIVDGATAVLNAFLTLDPSIQTVVVAVVGIAGAIAGLVAGMVLLGPVLAAGAASFGILAAAASPFLIPLLAITAAVAVLYTAWQTNFGGIQQVTAQVFEALQPAFVNIQNVLSTFGALLGTVFGNIGSILGPATQSLSDFLRPFLEQIPGAIRALGDFFNSISAIAQLLATGDFQGGIFGLDEDNGLIVFLIAVRDAFVSLLNLDIGGFFSHIGEAFTALGPVIGDALSSLGTFVGQQATILWGAIVTALEALPGQLAQAWAALTPVVGGLLRDFAAYVLQQAPALWQAVLDTTRDLPVRMLPLWQTMLETVGGLLRDLGLRIIQEAPQIWLGVLDATRELPSLLAPVWQAQLEAIGALLGQLGGFIRDHAPEAWRPLIDSAWELGTRIGEAFASLLGFVGDRIGAIADAIRSVGDPWAPFIEGAWNIGARLGDAFSNFLGFIGQALSGIPSLISGLGDLWEPFITGAWDIGARLGDAFSNFLSFIGQGFQAIPGIIEGLGDLWAPFINSAWNIGTALGDAFGNFLGFIGQALSGIPGLLEGLGDLWGPFIAGAWDIGTRIGDAISNVLGYIGEAIGGIPGLLGGLGDIFAPLIDQALAIVQRIGDVLAPIRQVLIDTFGAIPAWFSAAFGGGGGAPGGGGATTPLPTGGAGGPIVSIGTLVVSSPDEANAFLELVAQAVLASARRVTPPVGGANPALG